MHISNETKVKGTSAQLFEQVYKFLICTKVW